jgi:hypothetical protein
MNTLSIKLRDNYHLNNSRVLELRHKKINIIIMKNLNIII